MVRGLIEGVWSCIQRGSSSTDSIGGCLLNVPFVQTGKSHGHALTAENHAALQFQLAAHMERTGTGDFLTELGNQVCLQSESQAREVRHAEQSVTGYTLCRSGRKRRRRW